MSRLIGWSLVLAMLPSLLGCAGPKSGDSATGLRAAEDDRIRTADPAPRVKILPITHFASGQMLERQNNWAGAIEQYEKAIAANPRFGSAYNRLGAVHMAAGRLDRAAEAFRHGIAALDDAAYLRNNLGDLCRLRGRLDEAEELFRDALRIQPEFPRARNNLAIVLVQIGRSEEALGEFAHGLPPDRANCNVGIVLLTINRFQDARRFFNQALDLNPRSRGAREGLRRVTILAGDAGGRSLGDEP